MKSLIKNFRDELKIYRDILIKKIDNFDLYKQAIQNKSGIEIGGPSKIFHREIPVYRFIKKLDGVNFSNNTIWQGSISEGNNYNFYKKKPPGHQYISEATDLSKIKDNYYDFLISSNCLEHSANPLKAILEWRRVVKDEGVLILVLPKKELNFDHKRRDTKFSALLEAYENDFSESDLSTLDEIIENHDIELDPGVQNLEEFKIRSLQNNQNRCLHHHVYSSELIKDVLEFSNFNLIDTGSTYHDFFALAKKKSV
tara:strand:- start:908 stop:1672 length:765 start_codon:yes stop_codon:yes gene_type:complete